MFVNHRVVSFLFHGLSLSLSELVPLDIEFIKKVKAFMDEYNIEIDSEHISLDSLNFTSDLIG
ncbi:MAG: DUF692 family multinuclear iron-containing protein [Shewanella sp.]